MPRRRKKPITCVGCGCTHAKPCAGGCSWVITDPRTRGGICSACVDAPLDELLLVNGLPARAQLEGTILHATT